MGVNKKFYDLLRPIFRYVFRRRKNYSFPIVSEQDKGQSKKILVIGIYLTDYANQVVQIKRSMELSKKHQVDQKWFAIGQTAVPNNMQDVTVGHSLVRIPKFKILNQILSQINLKAYDLLIISDDDIYILENFIDSYVYYIDCYQLKIAQPARTRHSYFDHKICLQFRNNVQARSTNFVEIGPVFSIEKDVFEYILPFPEESLMGYGLDYIWPIVAQKKYFKIGIIDAVPVDHSYRPQGKTYLSNSNMILMKEFLSNRENSESDDKINYELFY